MNPQSDDAGGKRRSALAGIGAALIVALGLVAFQVTGRPPTAPPVAPALVWAPERLGQDWPAPVRVEPAGRQARVVPMVLGDDSKWDPDRTLWEPFEFGDMLTDGVPHEFPWLDIREVQFWPTPHMIEARGPAFRVILAGDAPSPQPAPGDAWMAYGFVFDTDGDGRADERIGMDNMAGDNHRAWWSDLETGAVSWKAGPPYGQVGGDGEGQGGAEVIALDTTFPGELERTRDHAFVVYEPAHPEFRFYAWVSLIQRGHVAFTDYAPDLGWLEPGAQPILAFDGPIWWRETVIKIDGGSYSIVQTLTVAPDGRLQINAACHAGTAALVIEDATLSVSDVAVEETTDCRPRGPETEKELLEILASGTITYSIEEGVLELRAGPREMRFRARFQGPFR